MSTFKLFAFIVASISLCHTLTTCKKPHVDHDAIDSDIDSWLDAVSVEIDSWEVRGASMFLDAPKVINLKCSKKILSDYQNNGYFRKILIEKMKLSQKNKFYYSKHYAYEYLPFLFCESIKLNPNRLYAFADCHFVQFTDLILALFGNESTDRSTWRKAFSYERVE